MLHATPPLLGATLMLAAAWLPAQAADMPNSSRITDTTTPIKSPFDSRAYRVLTLDNGLTALLVSDPEADKAAASMNVSVGSEQNPDDLQGLAHLLEHMLFLGTEPYPEPDAYQGYISRHAGSHNAFTAAQDTNYFFDIEPSALSGALDRFSAFFLSPLFNADKLESERSIVDSEYQARRRDESRRENDVLNQVLNPAHPGTQFSVGSLETLANRPAGEPTLRERVIDFYHGHYGAGVMHLAIVAPQSLDELEQLVTQRFAELPNRGLERPTIDAPLVEAESLPRYLERQTLTDSRQVRFLFPIPDPQSDYANKPTQLLSHLLGDEGEGSVLAALRDTGLADGLSAGAGRSDGEHALFNVAISLTPEGAKRLDDVQATLFAAIDNVAANGVKEWRYDEQARLQEQAFRFQQHGAPQHEATQLAMRLSRYPVKDAQYAPYRMDGFDAERTRTYLEALSPDNMIRIYSGPEVESEKVSPWFDTQWQEVSPSTDGQVVDTLALPAPNPFIADDLTLQSGHDDDPSVLMDDAHFTAWHMQVERFNTPKVEWRVSLQHPSVSRSAEEAVLNRLLAAWLNDSLNEALYPAQLAGQSFNAYAHARGMTLAFSGWRDGQAPLIERTLTQLENAPISLESFDRVQYQLERQWRNAPDSALFGQARRTLSQALLTPQWSTEELLAASRRLELHHLKDFRQRFLSGLYVDAMAVGNLDAELARTQASKIKHTLRPRLTRDDIPPLTPLAVSPDDGVLRPHSTRDESLVLRYLQGNEATPRQQATASVLAQWLQTPFYQRLRTQEQLGYIVNAGYYPLLEAPGLALVVQSPEADSATVAERMDVFMADITTRLNALDDATLAPYRQAVHSKLTQRDTSLGALANRYWQATALEDVRFDRRQRRAEQALEVGVDDVRTLWETLLGHRLDVRFDSGDTPSDVSTYRDGLSAFSATDTTDD
ncbi:Secreted Zn-dependent peptidases, insulinase-like [Vreelandella subglaciescola]|uniref:Protease 3 n=2 Tax=Vreelandella subglaciescola TaxID=29571 RepID=A0A1M7G9Z8_9GAMM|nr:Secreted Zn-dependent peptidases, insulinase-like [Halomonas subglaciescola]